jgi:hypothetical protein
MGHVAGLCGWLGRREHGKGFVGGLMVSALRLVKESWRWRGRGWVCCVDILMTALDWNGRSSYLEGIGTSVERWVCAT